MSETHEQNYPRDRKENKMTAGTEAYNLIHEIGGDPSRPVKAAVYRAFQRILPYLPLSISRVEDIWYGEARLIRAEEMDALRAAAAERRRKVEAGRAAANELATLYLGVAERLRAIDEDFHSQEIARLKQTARALGAMDRAGASPIALPLAPANGGDNA